MTVYLQDADLTLHHGDALETLRTLPAGSVNCCITSPPYLGLRDYGTGTWDGGNPDCDHVRDARKYADGCVGCGIAMQNATPGCSHCADRHAKRRKHGTPPDRNYETPPEDHWERPRARDQVTQAAQVFSDVCGKCGARRVAHQLGLEATPEEYVAALVAVFREVRRVLADDGTLWLNLGDSHANKQLQGVPWRVAFALQADGWYLRSDIIWSKPNPMPESVTDRPTKAHEYVFLLSKGPRYWFDQEAVREPQTGSSWATAKRASGTQERQGPKWDERHAANHAHVKGSGYDPAGRNVRSVWEIATQPFSDWTRTVRRRRVEPDAPDGGKKRTTSPDCPVHGDRPAQAPTASDGERVIGSSSHSGGTGDRLEQEPLDALAPTDRHLVLDSAACSSDSQDQSRSDAAIPNSTGNRRTALAPSTTETCTPSAESPVRTDDKSASPALSEPHPDTHENSISMDGSAAHPSAGTQSHSDCTCEWYVEYTEQTSHFATFPEELVRRCLLAGCPEWVCGTCGKARERIVDVERPSFADVEHRFSSKTDPGYRCKDGAGAFGKLSGQEMAARTKRTDLGWSDCGHCKRYKDDAEREGYYRPGVVLDPFFGSGTTGLVARKHGRHTVGIELSSSYCELAARRLQQLSLLAKGAV